MDPRDPLISAVSVSIFRRLTVTDRRNFIILGLLTILFSLTLIMVLPVVPLRASTLGATELVVGLLVAIPPLISVLVGIPISSAAPLLGLDRLMRAGFAVGIASGVLFTVASNPTFLIIPQVGFGLSLTLFMPQMISYYYRISTPSDRAAMQGYNTAFQGVGALIGPLIAGVVAQYQGIAWVFIWYAILSGVGYLLGWWLRPLDLTQPDRPFGRMVSASYRKAFHLIRTKEALRMSLFFGFLMVILWQGLGNTIFPLFIESRFPALAMMLGAMIAIREFGALLTRLFFSQLSRYMTLYTLLSASVGLMALGNLILPAVFHPVAIGLASLLLGLGLGPMFPAMNLLALNAVPPAEGPLAMAATGVWTQIGLMIMAPLLGGLAGTVGFENTFYLASSLSLIALVLFVRLRLWPLSAATR